MTKKILGIDITISQTEEILEEVRKYLVSSKNKEQRTKNKRLIPLIIFTPNPEIITYAQKDKIFTRIVNSAQINLPDGSGVVWALNKLYGIKVRKIAGIDFMLELLKLADKEGLRIGLIGGRGGVAVKTRECLLVNYPNLKLEALDIPEVEIQSAKLKIKNYNLKLKNKQKSDKDTSGVTEWAPPMVEESEDRYFISLVNEIRERKIDILFVALGFPKQEYFINQLSVVSCQLSVRPLLLMAVGGGFDYISGVVPRAPTWMRNMGLEWLFRLIIEPRRIIRQLKGAEFFLRIAFPSFFPIQYP